MKKPYIFDKSIDGRTLLRGLIILALAVLAILGIALHTFGGDCGVRNRSTKKPVAKSQDPCPAPLERHKDLGPKFVLAAFDITGSTSFDRAENEKAYMRLIRNLGPGDVLQSLFVTEATFRNPEFLSVHYKMPVKVGYFGEELKRQQKRVTSEFRRKMETVPAERAGTSILEGLHLFSALLQEQPNSYRKVLVLISDMKEDQKEVNFVTIGQRGDRILSELQADSRIPNFRGVSVYCMGASTVGLTALQWERQRDFWIRLFSLGGASVRGYDIGRNRQID